MMKPEPSGLPPGLRVIERGWLSSNSVVVLSADEAALVDTGYWTHAQQTVGLVDLAISSRPLTTIVNTHLHSDHCGGNAAIRLRHPSARTHIPPGQARAVREWDTVALTYEPTGQSCPRFGYEELLEPGLAITLAGQRWDAHAAPGHDPHSVVLFEPEHRILISADALWEHGFGVVFPELEGDHAFEEVAATLDLIEELDPLVVIPGHGRVFGSPGDALARARSRLRAYVANPRKHAAHAAKVLLKFKLLELQQIPMTDFLGWAESTPYLGIVHDRFVRGTTKRAWIAALLEDLARTGAVARDGALLVNA